jgi:hypothetical protein
LRRCTEQGHVVPAFGGNARGLHPGGTGTDHHYTAALLRTPRAPAGLAFGAELRVVHFRERLAGVDFAPGEIVVGRRADVVGKAGARLRAPVRIGDERAREADEIARAAGERGLRLGGRGDAPDRHHRRAGRHRPQLFMDVEKMPAPEMHVRHVVLEAHGEIALAIGEIVEPADERGGDARRLRRVDAARDALVAGQLQADDEIAAAALADRRRHFLHEAQAVLERAAVAVGAPIRPGREDLRNEVAVRAVQLDAAEAAALQPLGDGHILVADAAQLVGGHHMRHGPAKGVGLVGDALG